MSSKIAHTGVLGKMVVEAIEAVKTYNDMGDARYPVKAGQRSQYGCLPK
jgi:hypothetical protein